MADAEKMGIKEIIKKSLTCQQMARRWRLRNRQPDWKKIIGVDQDSWHADLHAATGPKILLATSVGAHLPGSILESLLAAALTLRKARIHVLLCDGVLSACQDCVLGSTISERQLARNGPQKKLCSSCFANVRRMFSALQLPVHLYSDYLGTAEKVRAEEIAEKTAAAKIAEFRWQGMKVGEHALAGALRFYGRGMLPEGKLAEQVLRRFFKAAMLTVFALKNLQQVEKFSCAVFHHGIYVPQGIIGEFFRKKNIRVVNWNPAYRKKCFIFSHNDTYHHTLLSEPQANWQNIPLTTALEKKIMDYLKSRRQGTQDWIWFHEKPEEDIQKIARQTGFDFTRPCIGLLTNVFWDAQLHYPANAFSNMLEWIEETIAYFQRRPDLQLLIRIHPAEIRGTIPSRQSISEEIGRMFPRLPANVFVIPAENPVSTYAAMEFCNAVIIYGTKTGVELASMGIPVIVAGEAWIRNKGLTSDARSREEYLAVLAELPCKSRMNEATMKRARKYAFHYFFRRMVPVDGIRQRKGWPPYGLGISRMAELLPGRSPGLDTICEGILSGKEFIFPAEHYIDKSN
jgi:hypothetical protein